MPGMREGNTAVILVALVVSVMALFVVVLRPPVIVNTPERPTPIESAHVVAVEPRALCSWNGTASYFYPQFWFANSGNRTARDTVANLTYVAAVPPEFTLHMNLSLGDIPAHTTGWIELDSVWVQWGLDVCSREHEFRVTMTWDP